MLCYEFPVCLGFLAARQSTSSKSEDLVLVLSLTRKHILMLSLSPVDTHALRISSHWIYSNLERQVLSSLFFMMTSHFLSVKGEGSRLSDFLGLNELSFSATLWTQTLVHRMYLNLRPILRDPVPPLPGYASRFLLFIQFGALFFSSLDTAQLLCRQILYCLSPQGSPGQRAWRSTSMGRGGEAWVLVSREQCFLGCGLESTIRGRGFPGWIIHESQGQSLVFGDSRHKPIDFHFATQPGLFINTV